jgi:hypothetical protein
MLENNKYTYEHERAPGAPTPKELQYWEEQLQRFKYQPPDPRARSEAHRRGWGFEDAFKPPQDCWDFVVANLKREWDVNLSHRIRPEVRYSLLTILQTYFAWLRTKTGTRWLLHLYGIEIISPHPGFAYFYRGERLVAPEFDLRLYQVDESASTGKSPDDYYGPRVIDWLKEIFEERCGPSTGAPVKPGDGMWRWIGAALRTWLRDKNLDRDWPYPKPDRITGYLWAKGLLRPGSQTDYVWTIIGKTEVYRDERIYRIQKPAYEERAVNGVMKRLQPENPGVVWDDRRNMQAVPLDDVARHTGVEKGTIDAQFRCHSCGQVRCCTTAKDGRNERLCMSCRGVQLERDDRPSLRLCQYRECRRCPVHLRTPEDYVNAVSGLNRSPDRRM